ncbi:hypothetical protein [[Mycoplasma] anseris]|uniref:Uncharacterized protein n=1 Tax=[Mycoplasma] anseris TaxID=92400 RepID=A0A2Z4NCS1_9BACT|nr:hypothetical protein [[Mycoplasma] anseris]AWX69368.1 hypothetical protein DP065_01185 [[Mycoplasma] anseris]
MNRYEEIIKIIWKYERQNLKEKIKQEGLPNWLKEKIEKTINRTSLDTKYKSIIEELLLNGDELLLTFFMKDPKRQNIYERIFKEEVEKEGFNIEKLSTHGKKAYYLINGNILQNPINKPKELKSLDFVITIKNKNTIL